jgi:hypothetical protein
MSIGGARLPGKGVGSFVSEFFPQVIEYLLDDHRLFDAGDDLHGATAFMTRLDVDIVYSAYCW